MADKSPTAPSAVVTGAGRGLGKEVARELARHGFRVVTCSTGDRGPGVGEELHLRADVTDPADVDLLVAGVLARCGRIDVVVNNAGYANPPSPLAETPNATAFRCFATNVLGPFYVLRRVLPEMAESPRGGVIVNIASRAALVPVPGLAAYSASKSALVSLTLALSKEYPDGRVLCVAVCPGGMDTEMRETVYGAEDARRQLDPRQVAAVVREIASKRSLSGRPVPTGSAVLVTKEGGAKVVAWPRDTRGHAGFVRG